MQKKNLFHKMGSFFINKIASKIKFRWIKIIILKKLEQHKYFEFKNKKMEYFFHSYNNFGLSERYIEIPIIKYYLENNIPERTLEIGNVSKHYYDLFRNFNIKDTIDKFETSYDVINLDIKDYNPEKKYDLIYSISTFEHMDSDFDRNPNYIKNDHEIFSSYAFEYMNYVIENILKKGGKFIITFPNGYGNCEIDNSFYKKEYLHFKVANVENFIYKRIKENTWLQKDIDEANGFKEKKSVDGRIYLCIMEITK